MTKSCETCVNGCDGWYLDHCARGCRKCTCRVSYNTLTKQSLKLYDTRKKKKKRFLARHKTTRKIFVEFGAAYLIFTAGYIGAVAGLVIEYIGPVQFILLILAASLVGYQVNKQSEREIILEFQEQIERLKKELRGSP